MFSSNTTQVSSGGYEIQRSLRFNSADSAYLNRTPSTASNRKTWTWSGWVKRATLSSGSVYSIFDCQLDGNNFFTFSFRNDVLAYDLCHTTAPTNRLILGTTAVYRDVSAWYHFVLSVDTTNATAANRIRAYVNGSEVTLNQYFIGSGYVAQNTDLAINSTASHALGRRNDGSGDLYLPAYMTEVNFIDGQALTPSSFGEFNADTGVWQPKRYAGSYGTNGFYLNFSDNSNTTAATLGKDYSGNGNNWTPNNFSVSAGAGNDSLVDSPTSYGTDTGVGGTVRGNYATLNPLSTTAGTYTQGNLRYTGASSWRRSNATISRSDGKWYWEVTLGNAPFSRSSNSEWNAFGFGVATAFNSTTAAASVTDAVILADSGYYKNFSGSWTDGGTAFSSGDVLSVAVDLDANTFTFRRNNTQIAAGTIGGTAGRELVPIIISYNGDFGVMDCNFGQRPFAYTAPSGFKALNTQNLPTPTIGATPATQANKYFDVVLRNGGAPSGGTYSTTVNMANGALLWDKPRNSASSNYLVDSVRGISKNLRSNTTDAESTDASWFTGFNNGSFSTGSSDWGSGTTVVDWIWAANGAGVTNTSGSITSTVSANTTSGFSVVTWTGNGIAASIGHGIGAAPKMVITKNRDNTWNWFTYHQDAGASYYLELNTTAGRNLDTAVWQNTAPTSSVFTIGSGINANGAKFVAYCFAEVPGYSKFGSYTGNGSSDGPFVFCGFRPAYVMIKNTTQGGGWMLWDDMRSPTNVADDLLYANLSNAETTYTGLDLTANGFKIRNTSSDFNWNGDTYIFAAFAEAPQKFALAR